MSIGIFLMALFNFYMIYKAHEDIQHTVMPCLRGFRDGSCDIKGALIVPGIDFLMLSVFAILFIIFAAIHLLLSLFYFTKNNAILHKNDF